MGSSNANHVGQNNSKVFINRSHDYIAKKENGEITAIIHGSRALNESNET